MQEKNEHRTKIKREMRKLLMLELKLLAENVKKLEILIICKLHFDGELERGDL